MQTIFLFKNLKERDHSDDGTNWGGGERDNIVMHL
jgi:hypothetical protein